MNKTVLDLFLSFSFIPLFLAFLDTDSRPYLLRYHATVTTITTTFFIMIVRYVHHRRCDRDSIRSVPFRSGAKHVGLVLDGQGQGQGVGGRAGYKVP